MSKNHDDQKKDPLRQGEPKRPHATLDLKAVEIKTPEQRAAEAKSAATAASTAAMSTSASAKPSASSTPDVKTPPPADANPGASATASTPSPSDKPPASSAKDAKHDTAKLHAATASAGTSTAASAMPPIATPSRGGGGGFGRFVSHSAAGLLGGFLALLGADTIAPQLGLSPHSMPSETAALLGARIAIIERNARNAATSGDSKLPDQLAAATARISKLEQLEQRVAALDQSQERLTADTREFGKKLTSIQSSESNATDPRLAKLEERLSLLASASSNGAAAGALPQLAAVTGKLADLESTMSNQITAMQKSVAADVEARMSKATEAAEAARSGTQRIDRELAEFKTASTRHAQRMEALKADNDRVGETLRVVQEETGKLVSGLDAIKGDLAARFKAAAKPEDVAGALAPVTNRIAALEKSVQGVVTAEDTRKTNAERIVLSLELANMKRVVDRGLGYADELAQVKKAAVGKLDLAILEKHKSEGVPPLPELQSSFRPLAHRIIEAAEATTEGGVIDRLLSGAKSVVKVRKVNHNPGDDSVEAVVARMDTALEEGRIGDFQALAEKLPEKARGPASGFLDKVAARHAVDKALKDIESQLKSSLGGTGAPAPAGQ